MIPPDAQRAMSKRAGSAVVEAKGCHAVYVSQPRTAADLIAKAASSMSRFHDTDDRAPEHSRDPG
jgi:hypothetical protein